MSYKNVYAFLGEPSHIIVLYEQLSKMPTLSVDPGCGNIEHDNHQDDSSQDENCSHDIVRYSE